MGAQIAGDGVFRARHYWLLPVEAGVENHGDAGECGKFFDDTIKARVRRAIDSLDTRRSIDVDRGRESYVPYPPALLVPSS